MAQLDTYKSVNAIVEDLIGIDGNAPAIKQILKGTAVTSSNPTDFTGIANGSALTLATVAVTGVAVGDIVLGFGIVSGLAANQYPVGAYVSATDVVSIVVGNLFNTSVTTTAMVVNVLVADVT